MGRDSGARAAEAAASGRRRRPRPGLSPTRANRHVPVASRWLAEAPVSQILATVTLHAQVCILRGFRVLEGVSESRLHYLAATPRMRSLLRLRRATMWPARSVFGLESS